MLHVLYKTLRLFHFYVIAVFLMLKITCGFPLCSNIVREFLVSFALTLGAESSRRFMYWPNYKFYLYISINLRIDNV